MIGPILNFQSTPETLWGEEYKIPWNEKGFSERMLQEHLAQSHDLASRKDATIDRYAQWIHQVLLDGKTSTLLDLGCGPGLYLQKLETLGHKCSGVDFSPASVDHARHHCEKSQIRLGDIRKVDYGSEYDLVMLVYGEINAFSPEECVEILQKIFDALRPGGTLLIEPTLFGSIKQGGLAPPSWFRNNMWNLESSLFSAKPHIGLVENRWFEDIGVARTDYWILEEGADKPIHYTNTLKGYSDSELQALLGGCGYQEVKFWGDFGEELTPTSDLQAVTARKANLA